MLEHKKSPIVNTVNDFSYALVSELRPVLAVNPNYVCQTINFSKKKNLFFLSKTEKMCK